MNTIPYQAYSKNPDIHYIELSWKYFSQRIQNKYNNRHNWTQDENDYIFTHEIGNGWEICYKTDNS